MTQDEFTVLMDTYGANRERWPVSSKPGALAFIKDQPAIADPLLLEARKLDEALDAARITPGTDMLKARILNEVSQLPSNQPASTQPANSNPGMKYRAVAAMMAISFVLGFAGANYMQPNNSSASEAVMVDNEWEEFADEYGMGDVYEWVEQDALP